jgi:hypothetical protein
MKQSGLMAEHHEQPGQWLPEVGLYFVVLFLRASRVIVLWTD